MAKEQAKIVIPGPQAGPFAMRTEIHNIEVSGLLIQLPDLGGIVQLTIEHGSIVLRTDSKDGLDVREDHKGSAHSKVTVAPTSEA